MKAYITDLIFFFNYSYIRKINVVNTFACISFKVRKLDESSLSNNVRSVFLSLARGLFLHDRSIVSLVLHIWLVPWALTSGHETKQG